MLKTAIHKIRDLYKTENIPGAILRLLVKILIMASVVIVTGYIGSRISDHPKNTEPAAAYY